MNKTTLEFNEYNKCMLKLEILTGQMMLFNMILQTFSSTNWSNDMQRVYCFMLWSEGTGELLELELTVTKTFLLSTVPLPPALNIKPVLRQSQCNVGNIPHKNTHFTDIYGVL